MTSTYPELYTKGTRVWIKHQSEVWQCAVIRADFDKNGTQLTVTTEEDEETVLSIKSTSELPPLRNPDILIGSNDLTSLSYLHEPSVLYNLRVRFLQHNSIYTWCGIVLVAVNPFTELEIYGEEIIHMYHSNSALAQLDPHIYAVAEDAFTKLECNSINQSVIVSGESGAGKTVSAKFAMRYFASIAGSDSNIESRVLASNPIMEAIGNAKTVRNDNSSRFGKYIQILFDRKSRAIMGGNMRTYLLEKSRVTYQGEGERNFHVFYQLCSHARQAKLDYLALHDQEFVYLGSNENSQYDDMSRFIEALHTLGFSEKQKDVIFKVVAAILHGGNIVFGSLADEESCAITPESLDSLSHLCRLLDLNETTTAKWLTSRLLKTGTREIIATPLNAKTAQYGLEALLKFIYEKMFAWIVMQINQALGPSLPISEYQFIGVLDIYGFEHFETNSFEQFCINYANEVLQQQFNLHVFKLEQEEYVREGIDWQFITFTDNQPVIDLIESKPIGILCLLDEECRMPQGSDLTWCSKLYKQIPVGEVFKKPKFAFQNSFIIEHFADVVTYSVEGFLEKNRDTIWEEQIDLLKRSSVAECLFIDEDGQSSGSDAKKGAGGKIKVSHTAITAQAQKKKAKATIGHQFRASLEALMRTLNSTEPHYVRCIKPNDNKAAFEFNNIRAVQQLRACGVLETIRISSNGFPSRWSYQDFANRYRVLRVGYQQRLAELRLTVAENDHQEDQPGRPKPTPRKLVRAGSSQAIEIRQICEDIVKIVYEEKVYSHFKLNKDGDSPDGQPAIQSELAKSRQLYQFGKTKIFFRPGQVALLERIRSQKLRECAILIQRNVRGWLARRRYQQIKSAVLQIQKFGRAYLAKKKYQFLRQTKAAIKIQTAWRRYHQRKVYLKMRSTILGLQNLARGFLARRKFLSVRKNLAAITIQRFWRGYSARKWYRNYRRKLILVQSCIRRYLAKRELRKLKIEARSVEHVTNLNRGLEKKIIELQQKINELVEEKKSVELRHLEAIDSMEQELNSVRVKLAAEEKSQKVELERMLQELRKSNEELMSTNQELMAKMVALEAKNVDFSEKVKILEGREQVKVVDEKRIKNAVQEREAQLMAEFERERRALMAERDREQMAKQELLARYMDLENTSAEGAGILENGVPHSESISEVTSGGTQVVDDTLEKISVMMKLTEMEQELAKMKSENQKLRKHIAKGVESSADSGAPNASADLLAEQFDELQQELERNRKEKQDLKRVILIEDRLTTFNGDGVETKKLKDDLTATYKSLYAKMDDEIATRDKTIQKLKTENLYLKCAPKNSSPNSSYLSIDPSLAPGSLGFDPHDLSPNSCYLGMYRFRKHNISFITRYLFYEFDPQNMKHVNNRCGSHTVAFITYMCVRYIDYENDEKMLQTFMNEAINWLRKKVQSVLKKNASSFETIIHLLACSFKISVLLKYYSEYEFDNSNENVDRKEKNDSGFSGEEQRSGEAPSTSHLDPDDLDSQQSLKNFDLTDYTGFLKEIMIWIYTKLIKVFLDKIQMLVVPAILENRELQGMSMRRSDSSVIKSDANNNGGSDPPSPTEREIHTLFQELSNMQATFRVHKLDEHFVFQFFKQVYYFMGTTALNNLLMRKDLCTNERSIEIIYNISLFEQFLREHNILRWEEVKATLDPILQASKLLIHNKTDKQIPAIILTTDALTVAQVVKIINMYTPADEEKISKDFLSTLTKALQKERIKTDLDRQNSKVVISNSMHRFPLTIPYLDDKDEHVVAMQSLHSFGLSCNLKEVEIPMVMSNLECYLEKI